MEESAKDAELREEQINAQQKLFEGFFEKLGSEMKQLLRHSTLLGLTTENVSGLMGSVGSERERVGMLPPHQVNRDPGVSKLVGAPNKYLSVCNSSLSSVINNPPSKTELTSEQNDKGDGLVNWEDGEEGSRTATCINTSRKRGRNLVPESTGSVDDEVVVIDECGDSRKKSRDSKSSMDGEEEQQEEEHLRNDESKSCNSPGAGVSEDRIRHLENEIKCLETESFECKKAFDQLKKENATLVLAVGEAKKEELKAKLEAFEVKSREADLLKEVEELKRQLSYQEGMVQSFTSVFKAMFFKDGWDAGLRARGVPEDSVLFTMHKVPEVVDSPSIGRRDRIEALPLSKVQASDRHEGPSCSCPEEQLESMTATEKMSRPQKATPRRSNGTEDGRHGESTLSKENASSCLAGEKINGTVDSSPNKVSDEAFHDFSGQRSLGKFELGQIWAMYKGGLPSTYAQIKKIEYCPFGLHVQSLEPCTMVQPLCCGAFKVQTGKALHSQSSFSHVVEAKSISKIKFEIYPKKGEVWAIYRNWNADSPRPDLENCEYNIVEVLKDTEQYMQVSSLVRVSGFKSVFRAPRGQRLNTGVMVIPRVELSRFSHQIPAFQLTEEKEGKLRGYWELDPAAVPDGFSFKEVMEDEDLFLQSNNEFEYEIRCLEDNSEFILAEGNENFCTDVIPSNVGSETPSNEIVNVSMSNVGDVFQTDEVFESRSALIEWCQNMGRTVNTVVIITKSEKATALRKGRLELGCERSGIYRIHHKVITPPVDKNTSSRDTATRKCNCPFKLKGIPLGEDRWKVIVLCGEHNHDLPNTLVGHAFAGRLSPEETQILAEMSASGVKPRQVLATLKRRNESNLSTMKTIYNAKAKLRQTNLERRTLMLQ